MSVERISDMLFYPYREVRRPYRRRREQYDPKKYKAYWERVKKEARDISDIPRVLEKRRKQGEQRRVRVENIPFGFGRATGIIPRDYQCLLRKKGKQAWLNSDVVEDYVKVCNEKQYHPMHSGQTFFAVSPYFAAMYVEPQADGKYREVDEKALSFFWSRLKEGPKCDLLSCRLRNIVIPINWGNLHWFFARIETFVMNVVDNGRHGYRFDYLCTIYDSLPNAARADQVFDRLAFIFRRLFPLLKPKTPDSVVAPFGLFERDYHDFGRQTTSCDCGVFMLDGMRSISMSRLPKLGNSNFSYYYDHQKEVVKARYRILSELMEVVRSQRRQNCPPSPEIRLLGNPEARQDDVEVALVRLKNFDRMDQTHRTYKRGTLYREKRPVGGPGGPEHLPFSDIMRSPFELPSSFDFRVPQGLKVPPTAIRLVWDNEDGTRTVLDWRLPPKVPVKEGYYDFYLLFALFCPQAVCV